MLFRSGGTLAREMTAPLPLPEPARPASPLAGMRLTELLDEVQERLATVARTQARVQELLDAVLSISTGLDLDATLRRIVESAARLVDARYGALGVLRTGGDGFVGTAPGAFVTVGTDDEQAAVVGAGPAGPPPQDPPARTSLGVPVLVRGEVFGNLRMTGRRTGRFTAEDEAVLVALAGAAGVAIDNARLYAEGEVRRRWLAAVADVRAELLGGLAPEDAFRLVVERVAGLTSADGAWLARRDPGQAGYRVQARAGLEPHTEVLVADGPVLQALSRAAGRTETAVALDLSTAGAAGAGPWGPAVAVPMHAVDSAEAVLVVCRRAGREPFDPALAPLISSFADQVALALDMAARQQVARQRDVYADRDRIARDLHDHVIQRLFAVGLSLQAVQTRVAEPDVAARVRAVVDQLDETVRDIRTTIFDLHTTGGDPGGSLRRRVLDITTAGAGTALAPTVRTSGAVDALVTGELAADVEAVVREGVSNAARHAGAARVTVTLDVGEQVVVEVVDDGRGIDPTVARSGLRNLDDRARRRGGACAVRALAGGGTLLRWHVPLPV